MTSPPGWIGGDSRVFAFPDAMPRCTCDRNGPGVTAGLSPPGRIRRTNHRNSSNPFPEVAMRRTFLLLLLVWPAPGVVSATPLGRAFTYQGQLSQSGVPVDGPVTLRFSLWDAAGAGDPPNGGTRIGNVQTVANVAVTGGVFSVALNGGDEFGAQAFGGDARWLQVEVCADSTCASSTVLGPRQAITGAPYALGPWQLS